MNCRQRLEKYLVRCDDNYDQQEREVFMNSGDDEDDKVMGEVFADSTHCLRLSNIQYVFGSFITVYRLLKIINI